MTSYGTYRVIRHIGTGGGLFWGIRTSWYLILALFTPPPPIKEKAFAFKLLITKLCPIAPAASQGACPRTERAKGRDALDMVTF